MTIEIPVLLLYFFGAVIGVIVLLLAVIGIASLSMFWGARWF